MELTKVKEVGDCRSFKFEYVNHILFLFAFENDFFYMIKKFYKQNLPKMSP